MKRVVVAVALMLHPQSAVAQESSCQAHFDTQNLPEAQTEWAEESIGHLDFPCERLGDRTISIEIGELDGPKGWASPEGYIQVDDDVASHKTFRKVLLHEIGHSVDFFYLTDAIRNRVKRIFDDRDGCWLEHRCSYENRVGEVFADAFVRAFSDVNPDLYGEGCPRRGVCRNRPRWITRERVQRVRNLLEA